MSLKSAFKKLFKPTKTKVVGFIAFTLLSFGISASVLNTASASGSAFDCDGNAVIYCGAPSMAELKTDYANSSNNLVAIYDSSPFNMDKASFMDFESNYQMGEVNTNNDVIVNGKVVATDAWTAGHWSMSGPACSNQYKNSAGLYVRQPACSFNPQSPTLSAYVYMPGGQFKFAVLVSCGNPVHATPVKSTLVPNYTITKKVRQSGNDPFMGSIIVQPDTLVEYEIVVKSTGAGDVKNLQVRDQLPANVEYKSGLAVDGRYFTGDYDKAGTDVYNFFHQKGVNVPDLAPGQQRVYTFSAIVGPHNTPTSCKQVVMDNWGVMWATGLPTEKAHADVEEACHPPTKPNSLECDNLVATPGAIDTSNNTEEYDFTATATPNNMTITKYVYSAGYNKETATVTTSKDSASTMLSYPYPVTQTYNATVVVYGQKGTVKTSASCETQIPPTSTTQTCTAPNGSTYPQGSPQCSPSTTPSCTQSQTTSSSCVTTPLPNTGPGSVIAIFAGASGLGALGRWFYLLRKAKSVLR